MCLISVLNARPVNGGGRRELFADRTLIGRLTPVRDKAWAGAFSGYLTILKDGGLFRIRWTKQELGLHQSQGVLSDAAPCSHNFCLMLDSRSGTPRKERFKARMRPPSIYTAIKKDYFRAPHIYIMNLQNEQGVEIPGFAATDSADVSSPDLYAMQFR